MIFSPTYFGNLLDAHVCIVLCLLLGYSIANIFSKFSEVVRFPISMVEAGVAMVQPIVRLKLF